MRDIPDDEKIATLTLLEPVEHTQHYECAAWYQTSRSDLGPFNLKLIQPMRDGRPNGPPGFEAELPATVVASNFTSYFGGVAIGSGRDNNTNGQRTKFHFFKTVLQAIEEPRISDIQQGAVEVALLHYHAVALAFRASIGGADHLLAVAGEDSDPTIFLNHTSQMAWQAGQLQEALKALEKLRKYARRYRDAEQHAEAIRRGAAKTVCGYDMKLDDAYRSYIPSDMPVAQRDEIRRLLGLRVW